MLPMRPEEKPAASQPPSRDRLLDIQTACATLLARCGGAGELRTRKVSSPSKRWPTRLMVWARSQKSDGQMLTGQGQAISGSPESSKNSDHIAIEVRNYRWRLAIPDGEEQDAGLDQRLA